jgi:hypothetical protein
VLRNVDEKELLAGASGDIAFTRAKPGAKVIDDSDVAALFGLEMAEPTAAEAPVPSAPMRAKQSKPPAAKAAAAAKKNAAGKKGAKGVKHLGVGGRIEVPFASAPARRRAS